MIVDSIADHLCHRMLGLADAVLVNSVRYKTPTSAGCIGIFDLSQW